MEKLVRQVAAEAGESLTSGLYAHRAAERANRRPVPYGSGERRGLRSHPRQCHTQHPIAIAATIDKAPIVKLSFELTLQLAMSLSCR
jgi:hypothetical protein